MTAPAAAQLTKSRKQFLFNVFVTALEGGIGYWACASEYHWRRPDAGENTHTLDAEDLDGFYAVVHEITDDETDEHFVKPDRLGILPGDMYRKAGMRIDADVLEKGIKLFDWFVNGVIDSQGQQVPLNQINPFRADHYFWQFVQANRTDGADGDYDADVADTIVQFALFGEVRYA
jgi:hypothetical protein